MSQPEWSTRLYDLQHRIWPGWSASGGDSEQVAEFLERWLELPAGARILDLGCGVGKEVLAFAKRSYRVTGCELSPELARLAKARLAAANATASIVVGDLLSFTGSGRFDLIYLWDSTLNIFDLDTASAVVARLRRMLAQDGWLVVQQLHDAFWARPMAPVLIEKPAIGPGRTERVYRFENGLLTDEVTWYPPGGEDAVTLPAQSLHLYPVQRFLDLLRECGLVSVEAVGSTDYAWRAVQPVGARSAMVAFRGRRR